jgi:hypothetical protein
MLKILLLDEPHASQLQSTIASTAYVLLHVNSFAQDKLNNIAIYVLQTILPRLTVPPKEHIHKQPVINWMTVLQ